MDLKDYKVIIVGSGFFGSVIAQKAAAKYKTPILVIEKRSHVGGNSFSEIDSESGIEYHKYGSHIFHTNSEDVFNYLTQFSELNSYRHTVYTKYKNKTYSMPINLGTINSFYELDLTPEEAKKFLENEIAKYKIAQPTNFEEKAISLIGKPLYEAFIKGYSEKQWEVKLTDLPSEIITRLPVRYNYNNRYFSDKFEGVPKDGYFKVFERMLSAKEIKVLTNTDYFEIKSSLSPNALTIYTGPIDRFFNYKHGYLGWRTVALEKEVLSVGDFQGNSVMNYAEKSIPYTRIHEFKHYHPERNYNFDKTVICREFSKFAKKEDDPYYPIDTEKDKKMFRLYREEADKLEDVVFGGRLAAYKYFDMHQVIGAALKSFNETISPKIEKKIK